MLEELGWPGLGWAGLGQLLYQALVYPHYQGKGSLTFPITTSSGRESLFASSYLLKEQVLCLCQLAAREYHHMLHISLHP